MPDPRFRQTVVYICEHNTEGAMGLIINKPMDNLNISKLLLQLDLVTEEQLNTIDEQKLLKAQLNKPVMYGGPIAEDQGFVLHTAVEGLQMSRSITPNIMLTSSKDVLDTLATSSSPENYLVVLGYAGWEPNQLEKEIADNGWLTIEASEDLLFKTAIFERWELAAKKLGIDIRRVSSQVGHA